MSESQLGLVRTEINRGIALCEVAEEGYRLQNYSSASDARKRANKAYVEARKLLDGVNGSAANELRMDLDRLQVCLVKLTRLTTIDQQ